MKTGLSVAATCLVGLLALTSRPRAQNTVAALSPFCGTETDIARKPTQGEAGERAAFICEAMDQWRQQLRDEMRGQSGQFSLELGEIVPFFDWDYYYVKRGLSWSPNVGQQGPKGVTVPPGFVSDLASIPRVFWQVLPPQGRYAYAAVVHDFLYWTQARPREEADEILKFALQDSKVNIVTVTTIYEAVRAFGQLAWNSNARLRKSGECRILDLRNYPPPLIARWSDWKRRPSVFWKDLCD